MFNVAHQRKRLLDTINSTDDSASDKAAVYMDIVSGALPRIEELEMALIETTRDRVWQGGAFRGTWEETEQAARKLLHKEGKI